jgi:hypothetical protein
MNSGKNADFKMTTLGDRNNLSNVFNTGRMSQLSNAGIKLTDYNLSENDLELIQLLIEGRFNNFGNKDALSKQLNAMSNEDMKEL